MTEHLQKEKKRCAAQFKPQRMQYGLQHERRGSSLHVQPVKLPPVRQNT